MVQRCNQVIIIQEQGVGANHPSKYKQDAARRGRVEGLLRAVGWPQAGARDNFVGML